MKNKLLVIFFVFLYQVAGAQTLSEIQMRNARATGYAIVAARNPGAPFSIYMLEWDGVNTLEHNATTRLNTAWHAQAVIKGNFFYEEFDGTDFSQYSSVILSQAQFDMYKHTGTQWWIVCSTLPPFSNSITSQDGNIGIGTTTPTNRLSVRGTLKWGNESTDNAYSGQDGLGLYLEQVGSSNNTDKIRIQSSKLGDGYNYAQFFVDPVNGFSFRALGNANGNVGIGTATPAHKLSVRGTLKWGNDSTDNAYSGQDGHGLYLEQVGSSHSTNNIRIQSSKLGDGYNYAQFFVDPVNGFSFRALGTANGNVGIGTNAPTEKLSVNGNVRAKKVIVSQSAWPDYVFHSSYSLRSLKDVEKFILKNHRLPEMPSATDVEKEGISVGDSQALLVKKVEELTLYIIDLQKQMDALKRVVKK